MFRSTALVAVLACGALGLACSNDPVSSPDVPDPGPLLRTAQSPPGPGAFVVHAGAISAWAFVAADLSLTVITGVSAEQLPLLCSGGEITYETGDYQLVQQPLLSGQEFLRSRNTTVAVYPGFFDFCSPPIAIGEGSSTFENISTNGAAGEMLVFHARVFDQSGEAHRILARLRLQVNAAGAERVFLEELEYR